MLLITIHCSSIKTSCIFASEKSNLLWTIPIWRQH